MHGQAAWEFAELCRLSGVRCDMARAGSRLVVSGLGGKQLTALAARGVGTPRDEQIEITLSRRKYDAVAVTTSAQVTQFKRIRVYDPSVALVVRHGNEELDRLRWMGIRNLMSPSVRALTRARVTNGFLSRKLIAWDRVPRPELDPAHREGVYSYISDYPLRWPQAFSRFRAVDRMLSPQKLVYFGKGSPAGTVDDLQRMRRSRVTLHLKDRGVCCNAVIRSMAMGTPVVMDRITYSRGHFDCIDGLLIRDNPASLAAILKGLSEDDALWTRAATATLAAARRQFTFDAAFGQRFRRFIRTSVNTSRSGWD